MKNQAKLTLLHSKFPIINANLHIIANNARLFKPCCILDEYLSDKQNLDRTVCGRLVIE